jgi:hypothetical protein
VEALCELLLLSMYLMALPTKQRKCTLHGGVCRNYCSIRAIYPGTSVAISHGGAVDGNGTINHVGKA